MLLSRMVACGDEVFTFGDPKGFPKDAKNQIEDMVRDRLFCDSKMDTFVEQYETFMKLAGPYWMSCVTKNDETPILDPDHYRKYLMPVTP